MNAEARRRREEANRQDAKAPRGPEQFWRHVAGTEGLELRAVARENFFVLIAAAWRAILASWRLGGSTPRLRASAFDPSIPPRTGYRPEIDGLRALAILPVVFFHYGVPGFRGGFVGVDVFFVISGYLITCIIQKEIERDDFSLANFYARRVRRIFPALFAMLAVVSAAAFIFFFPVDLVRYAQTLFATALFGANFEFWREAGYFDAFADQKPLLHLWSIAVEEQFYLLFPALLLALRRATPRRRIGAIACVLIASLALSAWGVVAAKVATFYLLPMRAWELMLGTLLALGAVPQPISRLAAELLAVLGVALILAAVFLFTSQTPFPGPAALIPCAGAALVILAAQPGKTFCGNLLASRPLVFVGLISYSLYLWHWPVFVFATYIDFREPSGISNLLLIALSFVLAMISWRYVERPFRSRHFRIRRRTAFGAAACAMAILAGSATVTASTDGLPQRLRPGLQRILAEQDDHEPRIEDCFFRTAQDVRDRRLCRIGAKNARPSFLLWGDSHADAILPAVSQAALRAGRAGIFAGGEACPPLLGVTTPIPGCRAFNDAVARLARDSGTTEVILEARWAKYAEGSTYGGEPSGHVSLLDDACSSNSDRDNHAVFERGLARTVANLQSLHKKVVIVAAIPEIGWPVPAVLARRALAEDTGSAAPRLADYLDRQRFVLATFAQFQRRYGATILYPHHVLCATGTCEIAIRGIPLYRDEHHLSVFGAQQLIPMLRNVF
ncbi:MAG TPA: acyltransferase family protein [Rhizomicrobium sp.]|nr:acyltransferase family protein [Rhizomicrobium sp.]